MSGVDREWFRLAADRKVALRALKMAAVVGFVMIAINHGDALMRGEWSAGRAAQMALTFMAPYCVSTISSVNALRDRAD